MKINNIDSLVNQMEEYKISTEDIKPIKFIMKDEKSLYDESMKEKVQGSQFISIIRAYPMTFIKRQTCISKDLKGTIYTVLEESFMKNHPCIYKYNDETIKIVSDWNYFYKLTNNIYKNLQNLEIKDLNKIYKYIEELQISEKMDKTKLFKLKKEI